MFSWGSWGFFSISCFVIWRLVDYEDEVERSSEVGGVSMFCSWIYGSLVR